MTYFAQIQLYLGQLRKDIGSNLDQTCIILLISVLAPDFVLAYPQCIILTTCIPDAGRLIFYSIFLHSCSHLFTMVSKPQTLQKFHNLLLAIRCLL